MTLYVYLVFFDPELPVDDDLLGYFPTVVNRVSKLLFIIFEVTLKIYDIYNSLNKVFQTFCLPL